MRVCVLECVGACVCQNVFTFKISIYLLKVVEQTWHSAVLVVDLKFPTKSFHN